MTPFREHNKTAIGGSASPLIVALVAGVLQTSTPIIGGGDGRTRPSSARPPACEPKDEVRVAGVKVGKVVGVELAGDHVVVKMRLRTSSSATATRADIRIKTVLGRKYIVVAPDGDGELRARHAIPLDAHEGAVRHRRGLPGPRHDGRRDRRRPAGAGLHDAGGHLPRHPRRRARLARRAVPAVADDRLARRRAAACCSTAAAASPTCSPARDEDLVGVPGRQHLVLRGGQAPPGGDHRLLVTTRRCPSSWRAGPGEPRRRSSRRSTAAAGRRRRAHENQANLDRSIERLAPFVRVFANNLGNGRWFDTYVQNLTNPSGFVPGVVRRRADACTGGPRDAAASSLLPRGRSA